ncbi:MAG: hypothetical protein IJ224_06740 [Lachnospiraceae bacterium]|nr:hypothetical protein [Lachnospiraceae bacterium]
MFNSIFGIDDSNGLCQKYLNNPELMKMADEIYSEMEKRIFPIKNSSNGVFRNNEKELTVYVLLVPLKSNCGKQFGMDGVQCEAFSFDKSSYTVQVGFAQKEYFTHRGYSPVMDNESNKQFALVDSFTERFLLNLKKSKNDSILSVQLYKKRVKVNNEPTQVKGFSTAFKDHIWGILKLKGNIISINLNNPNYEIPKPLKQL